MDDAPENARDELTPERLASASLIIAAWPDGSAHMTVADDVEDAAVATYLRTLAEVVERGGHRDSCEACATGVQHEHP